MELPPHDRKSKFYRGGVLYVKMPTSIVLQFYTHGGRIITDTAVPYFLFKDANGLAITAKGAWESANMQVSENHLSLPSEGKIKEIVDTMLELMEMG